MILHLVIFGTLFVLGIFSYICSSSRFEESEQTSTPMEEALEDFPPRQEV